MSSYIKKHGKGILKESAFMFIVIFLIQVILDANEGKEFMGPHPLRFLMFMAFAGITGGIGLHHINVWAGNKKVDSE